MDVTFRFTNRCFPTHDCFLSVRAGWLVSTCHKGPSQGFRSKGSKTHKGEAHFKMQHWMYAATGGQKWSGGHRFWMEGRIPLDPCGDGPAVICVKRISPRVCSLLGTDQILWLGFTNRVFVLLAPVMESWDPFLRVLDSVSKATGLETLNTAKKWFNKIFYNSTLFVCGICR